MKNIAISSHQNWPRVSRRIGELLRQGAELGLSLATTPELMDEMDDINKNIDTSVSFQDDPVFAARNRRTTQASIIHWLTETIEAPDKPVSAILLSDTIKISRELPLQEAADFLHSNSRAVQDIAWQHWMKIAFQITRDPAELEQLLEVSSLSINTFTSACLDLALARLKQDAANDNQSKMEQQKALAIRLIEGADLEESADKEGINQRYTLDQASHILGYSFRQNHHAAIVWSEEIDTEISALESVAAAFQKACHQSQSLKIIASPSVIWVWAAAELPINDKVLESSLAKTGNVRLSYGTAGQGLDGFRRAHLDAQAAQRVLGRLKSNIQLVSYDRVRLMAFLSKDAKSIQHYSEYVLGELAQAPALVRQSLHTFLECGCNATDAAKKLHTHRNTLLRRLAKAEEMLPRPLSENRIQVAVALEALYWIL